MDELEKCYNIIMAEAAGTSVEGGIEEMTEAERKALYREYIFLIDMAATVGEYFKKYVDERKEMTENGAF